MPRAAGALTGGLGRDELYDRGAARPVLLDVLRSFFGPELPDGVTAVAFLVIRCSERDLALPLELATDLAVELWLVRFDGQGDVGTLVEAPAKKSRVVCSASAWIKTPSSFIVLRSCLRAARSLDSWVSWLFCASATPSARA